MKKATAKGYMFEAIIGELLKAVGYSWSSTQGSGKVPGRGAEHEIDAISLGHYTLPFINNIRLLAEAKYKKSKVDLPIVRNIVGALLDINESYKPKRNESIAKKLLGTRNTNCAVIFSNQDFTKDAINYGYAHNIYLVSYAGNPVIKTIVGSFEEICAFIDFRKIGKSKNLLKTRFANLIKGEGPIAGDIKLLKRATLHNQEFLSKLNAFRESIFSTSSILGFIGGSYPIHLISDSNNLANYLTSEAIRRQGGVLEIGYKFHPEGKNLVFWFPFNEDKKAYFVLPRYLFPERKIRDRNLVEEKEEYLKNIIIPFIDPSGVVVMIRLKFNRNLL